MTDTATSSYEAIAFPVLDTSDPAALKPFGKSCSYADGDFVFRAGDRMSEYLVGRIRASANIQLHEGVEISDVRGEPRLETISLRPFDPDPNSKAHGKPSETIRVSAAFVFIGAEPGCSWLPKDVARDKLGYILNGTDALQSGHWPLADREPCPLETTVPGILAAGDIRAGSTKRVGFAVGDGSLAVTCVHKLVAIRS